MGIPYVPVIGLVGSDLTTNRDDMRIEPDPFEPERKTLVAKALRPDVALLHGLKADREGNILLGRASDDVLLAEASRRTIVSVEEVVDRLDDAEMGAALPALLVDGVLEAPFGAHPCACPGRYPADAAHMAEYLQAAQADETFRAYVERTVHDLPDHDSYVTAFVPPAWRGDLPQAGTG